MDTQLIGYAIFGFFLIISSCILVYMFFQNGGMENCNDCTTPTENKMIEEETDTKAPDSPGTPQSREAWGDTSEAGADGALDRKQERSKSPSVAPAKKLGRTALPLELQDPDRGNPLSYDPNFKGPKPAADREKSDTLFLVGFTLSILLLILIMVSASLNGDYTRLVYGTPDMGNVSGARCGTGDYVGKEYLIWPSPVSSSVSNATEFSMCVAACPAKGDVLCASEGVLKGKCWTITWGMTSALYRCKVASCSSDPLWSGAQCTAAKQMVFDSFPSLIPALFADIVDCKIAMAIGVAVGISTGFAWLFSLKAMPECSVTYSTWLSLLSATVFSVYILLDTGSVSTSGEADHTSATSDTNYGDYTSYATLLLGLSIFVCVLIAASMLCYLRRHKEDVAFIVREASVSIQAIPGIMYLPIVPILIVLLLSSAWLYTAVEFLSQDYSAYHGGGEILFLVALVFQLLVLFWMVEFIMAVANISISGAVCTWYWSKPGDLKVVERNELWQAVNRGSCSHLGTLARYSCKMAAFKGTAGMLGALRRGSHPHEGTACCQVLGGLACGCFLLPLAEMHIFKLLGTGALVQVALHGASLHEASLQAFSLMYRSRHLTQFAANINERMLYVAKLFMMCVAGTVTFALLHHQANVYNPTGPTCVVCFVVWVIGTCFTDMYLMTVDSIMMCFAEDREKHDGSYMRQYFMTAGLKQLILEDLNQTDRPGEDDDIIESSDSENEKEAADDSTLLVDMSNDQKQELEELDMYSQ